MGDDGGDRERSRGQELEQLALTLGISNRVQFLGAVDRAKLMPLFARAGAILPSQPYGPHEPTRPPDPLTLTVWGGADGRFRLYEDGGDGAG